MDNNFKLERDKPNYDYEFVSNNEWLDVHINLLFNSFQKSPLIIGWRFLFLINGRKISREHILEAPNILEE